MQNVAIFPYLGVTNIQINMDTNKSKVINVRVDQDIYDKLVKLAINRSKDTNRIVRLSELVRDGIMLVVK